MKPAQFTELLVRRARLNLQLPTQQNINLTLAFGFAGKWHHILWCIQVLGSQDFVSLDITNKHFSVQYMCQTCKIKLLQAQEKLSISITTNNNMNYEYFINLVNRKPIMNT